MTLSPERAARSFGFKLTIHTDVPGKPVLDGTYLFPDVVRLVD